jgi:hypothetical protein
MSITYLYSLCSMYFRNKIVTRLIIKLPLTSIYVGHSDIVSVTRHHHMNGLFMNERIYGMYSCYVLLRFLSITYHSKLIPISR